MKIYGVDNRALIQVDIDNSRTLDDSDGMRDWRGPNLLDKMLVIMWQRRQPPGRLLIMSISLSYKDTSWN